MISVSIDNIKQFNEVLTIKEVDEIIINRESFEDENIDKLLFNIKNKNKKASLMLETISRLEQNDEDKKLFDILNIDEIDSIIVQNMNSFFYILKNVHKKVDITFNYNMNIYNNHTKKSYIEFSKDKFDNIKFVAPVELNFRELSDVKYDVIVVYGYIPLMVSKNCIYKNTNKCKHNHFGYIYDRKNVKFGFKSYCKFCYNKIFNSVPIDIRNNIKDIKIDNYRYDFIDEDVSIIKPIIYNQYNIENKTYGHYINTIK